MIINVQWFALVLLFFDGASINTIQFPQYGSMDECFQAREQVVENVGRPIVNYQALCIPIDPDYQLNKRS